MTVYVPDEVFEGLEAVRLEGETNMIMATVVQQLCYDYGYDEAGDWLAEKKNRGLLVKGVFEGVEPESNRKKKGK